MNLRDADTEKETMMTYICKTLYDELGDDFLNHFKSSFLDKITFKFTIADIKKSEEIADREFG